MLVMLVSQLPFAIFAPCIVSEADWYNSLIGSTNMDSHNDTAKSEGIFLYCRDFDCKHAFVLFVD